MLPGELITFRAITGEFADSTRYPEFELATGMVPGVSMEVVHDRVTVEQGESPVTTLLVRPFRSIGRPDVVVIVDVSQASLRRELQNRIALLDRFTISEGAPDEPTPDDEDGSTVATVVSSTFGRRFTVTLRDNRVVDQRGGLTFVLGSIAAALVVFLITALTMVRKLTPLERELQRLADRPANLASLADAVRTLTQDNEQLRLRYDQVLPHYRRRVMNHLLLGLVSDTETLDERLGFTGMQLPDPPYVALCFLFADAENSDRESASLVLLIASALELEIGPGPAGLLAAVDAIRYGTVIPASSVGQLPRILARLPEAARDQLYLGVGERAEQPGELATSYETARRALAFRRVLDGRVFDYEAIVARARDQHGYPFELERSLIQAVQHRNVTEAEQRLAQMLASIRASADATRSLEYLRLQLLHILEGRLAAGGASPTVLDQTIDQHPLEEANTPESIHTLFRELVRRATTEGAQSTQRDQQVVRFLEYIDEHHADKDLQLLTLEETFGLSRYYIGRRIKEETGLHFNDHLNRARLERGARLLAEEPGTTIKEIAARVGYSYNYYFARQFRQIYGVSPSEYRESAIQTSTGRTD
jgi:AraC-like DNA-binding protein